MLEDSLFESRGTGRTRKPVTVIASSVVHCAAVSVLILAPLLQSHAVPKIRVTEFLRPLAAPKPSVVEVEIVRTAPRTQVAPDPGAVIAPKSITDSIAIIVDPPEAGMAGLPRADISNGPGSILRGIFGRQPETAAPEPPPQEILPPNELR